MATVFLGLYGIFALLVGVKGKGKGAIALLSEDAYPYISWVLAIVALSVLYEFDETRPMIKPIMLLLALNFFLRNFDTIESQVKQIYALSTTNQGN